MEEQYIQILEKTNQQLSLWYNPYGVMIMVLTALFTLLAIIAAVIIYRQGRDYKEKIEQDRKTYKDAIEEFLKEQREKIADAGKQIDDLLLGYKEQLSMTSKAQKEEIEEAIKELQIQKSKVEADLSIDSNKFVKFSSDGGIKKVIITLPNNATAEMVQRLSKYLSTCPSGDVKVFLFHGENKLETPFSINADPHTLKGIEIAIEVPF